VESWEVEALVNWSLKSGAAVRGARLKVATWRGLAFPIVVKMKVAC